MRSHRTHVVVLALGLTVAGCPKAAEDDPDLPKKKAARALAKFMSLHPHNIEQKTEVIVEHFRRSVAHRLGGRGKAMVVTSSRLHAVRYKLAFEARDRIRIGSKRRRQDLDGNIAAEPGIAGAIHLTHSAFAQLVDDLVGAEPGTRTERHVFHCSGWLALSVEVRGSSFRVLGSGSRFVVPVRGSSFPFQVHRSHQW